MGPTLPMARRAALLWACGLLLTLAAPDRAPAGPRGTVVFGQSACFTGPNRNLGLDYRAGLRAAFDERNGEGGVNGRSLELVSVDDAYEPGLAAANAERFAGDDEVLAVIGGVGTPTAKRIAPVLRTARIPFVGPFTGADFLRNAERFPNVINLRAGYLDETRVLVDRILLELGKTRLGIIYQDDAFGRSVLKNYKTVLDGHGIPMLAKTAFSRNTHAVHASLFGLAKADLEAILLVGTYATNSEIINLAHSLGHEYITANLSFVLSYELKKRVDAPGDRVLVTEVVPDAGDTTRAVVRSLHRALAAEDRINEVSLEGYILGRFVAAVLERMGDELTRENFTKQALSSGPVVIDDWTLEFEPGTNTGSHYVRLIDLGGHTTERRIGH